ncbi:MAG: DEAD/DEAH box helicase [Chloroflexi bacterium]|nr:DEAD/DEAH box helicase [Chloroflexota bacterium]
MRDILEIFSSATREWFRETFGAPTPPQSQGWDSIQRGEHTLILAPTGSGKTLAAFLWGIDELFQKPGFLKKPGFSGVHLLYVSPLKALNNDIERNLRQPLDGIRATAERLKIDLPTLRVAVRTGDTPQTQRAAMWKHPPHILITTPESLYLMLTSPRAREMFRTTRTVIVDEIHTLCGNKRGVHLALSLERLEHLATGRVQRIGLSATIKPLDEVARFLGGQESVNSEQSAVNEQSTVQHPTSNHQPRPVTIVDAGYHKPLDLQVVTVVEDFRELPGETVWPSVVPHVLNDIRQHHTTLVFANNRRLAERTADRLNAQLDAEQREEIPPGSTEALAPGGLPRDRGIFAIGAEGPIRAHHGSMSKETRRKLEEDLKAGRLPALVGTSSLELGIDIGAVDLVVQLQSPKSVAQGLQRVGRSGHLVGQTSVGRIYATFREDLVEAAAIARGMLDGDVEQTHTPENPLDVLAQQIVAMVACETWDVSALYDRVRGAYPYRNLSRESFYSVLEMLSGKYERVRARISWDRVNGRLAALPGSRLLAITNCGTIADTGAFGVYLPDGKTKVGELDEEFIFETRVGDTFLLGSHTWRVREIADDRIVVEDAAGATPRMPFWNGDYPWRPYELGVRIGKFRREIAEKFVGATHASPLQEIEKWLRDEYTLDENSIRNLIAHAQRQLDAIGVIASDTTIVVESFQDTIGEPRLVIHSPFGGRVNGAWALALMSALRERAGVQVETQTNDDGILFRFPSTREPPVDIVQKLTAADARERILRELPNSAVFGAQFRMNAGRALLLPKARGHKRTPFWLQRLKAKDLLALVSRYENFPIIAETYRDCLRDVFDLPHLEEILNQIQNGDIRIVPIETIVPSPVASELLFNFISVYMYEWDAPKAERQMQSLALRRETLDDVLGSDAMRNLLKPEAIAETQSREQHLSPEFRARTAEELALILHELGDLTEDEIIARSAGDASAWINQLAEQGRIARVTIRNESRWTPVELIHEYQSPDHEKILRRLLTNSAALTRRDILNRYAFPETWLDETLARLVAAREIAQMGDEFCDRRNLEQIHRRTLTLLRKEIQPVSLYAYADFLTRWQHCDARLSGAPGLRRVMEQLRGIASSREVWEHAALPARLTDFDPADLDALCRSGDLVWVAQKSSVRFFLRGEGGLFINAADISALSEPAQRVYEFLKAEGASFTTDLENALGVKDGSRAFGELVAAGLITNDSLDALQLAQRINPPGVARSADTSALAAELATRLADVPRPLTHSRYRDAKRRVAKRLREQLPIVNVEGRWSIVHRATILGQPLNDEARAAKLAQVLLWRYGIVTRDCIEHEEIQTAWALLYLHLQRMELRGEVRRGYFVEGLAGAQFALPDAVEKLRGASQTPSDALIVLNATDPGNVFGAPRLTRVPSTDLVLWRGQPVIIAENNGEAINTTSEIEPSVIARAVGVYLARVGASRRMLVKQWNQADILTSPGEPILKSLGFYRTPNGMEK